MASNATPDPVAMGHLQAIAAGGKSGGDAYAQAASQMSAQRAAALSGALGRSAAVPGTPAAFNSYVAPRITGAFDAKIPEMGALGAANNTFRNTLSSAAAEKAAGLKSLAPLMGQQSALQFSTGGKYDPMKLMNSQLSGLLSPLDMQNKVANTQYYQQRSNTAQGKLNVQKTLTTGQGIDPTTRSLGNEIFGSNSNPLDAYQVIGALQTYAQTGKDTTPNKSLAKNLGAIGLNRNALKSYDFNQLNDLANQYYGLS